MSPSVHPRILAARSTRNTTRRARALAAVKPQVLQRINPSTNSVKGSYAALSAALADKRSPYPALIIKSVSRNAFHALKSVIAGVSGGPTYACRISADLEGDALSKRLQTAHKDLTRLGKNNVATLAVYWEGGDSPKGDQMSGLAALLGGGGGGAAPSNGSEGGDDVAWGDEVAEFVKAVHAVSPATQVVIVTPRSAVDEEEALEKFEVQDALSWGSKLDEMGHLEHAERVARALQLKVDAPTLKAALRDVPFEEVRPVLKHALVLQKRFHGDAAPKLDAAVASYWQQTPSGADDAIGRYLRDADETGFDKSYFGAPAQVHTFVDAVRNARAFGAVNAKLPHALVLDAGHESGTGELAHAVAGELNAAFMRLEDVDLLEVLSDEKGPGLPGLLDAANAYGRERNSHVVVYLGQLEALLSLGVNGMAAIGKGAGREHIVVVTAGDDLDSEMRTRLQPHVHQAALTTPKHQALQGFWRYYLTQEHPAHSLDDAAIARVATASAGFYVEEVRQALVQAGNLAFARRNEGPAQIVEADVLAACKQASEARRLIQPYVVELTGAGLAGVSNLPPEVAGFVQLLKRYDEAKAIDRHANKSILLQGAAGVGKLNIARAIADEMGGSLFALHKNEILSALGNEEIGLNGLLKQMNTLAQQQDKPAVVYLGDIESALGAGANAEESVGFNPVGAQIATLAKQSGNDPAFNRMILVAGTSDPRVVETGVLGDAFQVTAEVRAPSTEALVELFRRALAADHPANNIDAEGLARIARYGAGSMVGFNGGHVERVLHNASRFAWQRPMGEGPLRLEVKDVLLSIDAESSRASKFNFYT